MVTVVKPPTPNIQYRSLSILASILASSSDLAVSIFVSRSDFALSILASRSDLAVSILALSSDFAVSILVSRSDRVVSIFVSSFRLSSRSCRPCSSTIRIRISFFPSKFPKALATLTASLASSVCIVIALTPCRHYNISCQGTHPLHLGILWAIGH